MPGMKVKLTTELQEKLNRLALQKVDAIAKKAVYAGAGIMADKVRENLEKNLQDSKYSTGELLASLGITPPRVDRNGIINAKVGFSGYDSKGVPNALKARAMESGTSKQPKRPFVAPAARQAKKKAEEAMINVIVGEIGKELKK